MNRQSKDIADIIRDFLKKNNKIKLVSQKDITEIGNISMMESYKFWIVVEILEFNKIITQQKPQLLWYNNYYVEKNYEEIK